MNVMALCAGAGGLELGLELAVPTASTVAYVEGEAYAAAILVARMEAGDLDHAPVWSDLRTFDGRPWRGVVDCITAGFPCQPVSVAGRRLAQADPRWLWPDTARVIGEVRPRFVFLENVPGIIAAGLGDVLASLAARGYDAEWSCFSAAEVGAPHRRERWFCLAYSHDARLALDPGQRGDAREERQTVERSGWAMVNAASERWEEWWAEPKVPVRQPVPVGASLLFPPRLGRSDEWREYLAAGGPEPAVRRSHDGMAHRVDRLRLGGNGVVPLVAAHAFRTLAARAGLTAMQEF